MRLSEYTDYTLRVLMYCAALPQALITIGELAEHHALSNHLMKVVNDLARQGLLETTRGLRDRLPPGRVFRPSHQRLHPDAQLSPEAPDRCGPAGLLQGVGRRDAGRHGRVRPPKGRSTAGWRRWAHAGGYHHRDCTPIQAQAGPGGRTARLMRPRSP
jgi:Iron-dependent Transcriptional regulator